MGLELGIDEWDFFFSNFDQRDIRYGLDRVGLWLKCGGDCQAVAQCVVCVGWQVGNK